MVAKRMPTVRAHAMIRALESAGFVVSRKRGSHVFLRHTDGRTTTVPDHAGKDISRGLLRKILKDVEIDPETFKTLL